MEKIEEMKVCSKCGINEEEAYKQGMTIEKLGGKIEKIEKDGFVVNATLVDSPDGDMYLCTRHREELQDKIKDAITKVTTSDKLNKIKQRQRAFEDFVSSSAYLFDIDEQIIAETCFRMYMMVMSDVGKKNPNLITQIIQSHIDAMYMVIADCKETETKIEERNKIGRELSKN